MIQMVIFDLDGTLVNSLTDLALNVNKGLRAAGLPEHPVARYRSFVGNGRAMLVKRAMGEASGDAEKYDTVVRVFNEEYAVHYNDNTAAYEGCDAMLRELASRGILTAVLSNKPDEFVDRILQKFYPCHTFADDPVKQPFHAERLGHGGDYGSKNHPRRPDHVDRELQFIGIVHSDARHGLARMGGKQLCPEAGPDLFLGINVPGAHGHHLRAEREHIPGPGQGKNVAADQLRLVLAHFDKMGLDGEAVISAAVPAGKRSAVETDDAVLFAALLLEIPGRVDAQCIHLQGFAFSKRLYLHRNCMSMREFHHIYCVLSGNLLSLAGFGPRP